MEVTIKKNEEYIVDIIDYGYQGEGVAKINGYTIFVREGMVGEKCKVLILKVTPSHTFAKIIEILAKAPNRNEPDCATYKRCGGCQLRHMKYDTTLEIKKDVVQNLANKMLKQKIQVEKVIGMEEPFYYRNKAQYPVGLNKENKPVVGVFALRTHEIIPMENCRIQHPVSEFLAKEIVKYSIENNISVYKEETNTGLLRHIVVKVGFKTKEVMCVLVINGTKLPQEDKIVETLRNAIILKFPNYILKTIVVNTNTQNTNVILGEKNRVIYGDGFIYDKLGEYTFKISPMSFYQVNTVQTEILYKTAIQFANLSNNDIVLDLYCGIGTIGIFASKKVKKVYGIEIVEQAITDAKENAKQNKIENIEFLCGDVEKTLKNVLLKTGKPDVIFVDPPRRGLDNNTISNILQVEPKKLIYISCNPSTLMRDLKSFEEKYEIKKIQPVDMFPFTPHVECVALLELK